MHGAQSAKTKAHEDPYISSISCFLTSNDAISVLEFLCNHMGVDRTSCLVKAGEIKKFNLNKNVFNKFCCSYI